MGIAEWLRVAVALIGVVLTIADFMAFCKKRLNEASAFAWGVFGIVLVICSVVPGLSGWSSALASNTTIFYVLMGVVVLWMLFTMSVNISNLISRNRELAMQISLLNHENQRVLKYLQELSAGEDTEIVGVKDEI